MIKAVLWLTTGRYHWEMYPHNREVPEHLVQELLGILVHAGVGMLKPVFNVMSLMSGPDCMTSPNSTAAYSEGDLSKLLGYARYIASVGGNYGFSACVVGKSSIPHPTVFSSQFLSGRLMSFISTSKFLWVERRDADKASR